jgi:MFS family permease
MDDGNRTKQTYRYERWRALSSGIIETAGSTFLLLIAVRWYHAGSFAKALIAGGGSIGLMLGPWLVSVVENTGWPVAKGVVRLAWTGAVAFLLMAVFPTLWMFVAGAMVAMTCATAAIPLMTQIYQENYPSATRGKLFSRTFMIRIATAAIFSELAGRALSGHIEYFRWLLFVFSVSFAFAGFCIGRLPSRPLTASGGTHPFRALRFVRDDELFRRTLVMWMLMGFANLMIIPLRVEYLANTAKYNVLWDGHALTAANIALFTGVIPNIARFIMSPVWGWLFDRINFFALRMTLNMGFALGMLTFFASDDTTGLIAGAIIYGISTAGGDVAWSLWVTKFAPSERVADYMSVHTFFTGVRGVLAPVVVFQLASFWSPQAISWFGAGLIVIATAILIPEIKFGKRARKASALVEEVSE